MTFKAITTLFIGFGILSSCSFDNDKGLTQFVDTSIGTGGHGHVFVGANVPFGLIQLGPTSIPEDWDWCSGYHQSDSSVIGFSHTHLSGTGIGDLFDITVMPVVGKANSYKRGESGKDNSGLWSYAERSKEISEPGYYSVPLIRYGITAEMTATSRVGFHRYSFPESDEAGIVIDLENGGCWDKSWETFAVADGNQRIVGWRFSRGWASDQRVWFVAEFSKPFDEFKLLGNEGMYARANFKTKKGEKILMKVALSPTSIESAKANMVAELPGWDFDEIKTSAAGKWDEVLNKIKIETKDETAKRIFYTALYHTMIAPSEFCDADGRYRGANGLIKDNPGHKTYTTYSLWDTYRAAMPLMTIIHPQMSSDMINNMLDIFDEQGCLPVWHLWGCETNCMVGNPGVIAVADAVVKGIEGIDKERAFNAMKVTMLSDSRGGDLRKKYGFIPSDLFNESIAYDMEYAIADGAVAAAARALGKDDEAEFFTERSHSYRNYFDPSCGFVRGRFSDGSWRTPFSPFRSSHREDDYCEGNAWQYTWLVPHDIEGLQDCFGGKEKIISKLDSLFLVSSVIEGEDVSPDISGLIGQYAHGNEPSHHILYLYAMLGEGWKTAEKVREVLSTMYKDSPDGLSGNEDVGQMSAWYILSALGFYEAEPAGGRYWFGSPIFDKAEIEVPGGTFTIIAEGVSAENKYISRVLLNGEEYSKPWISHSDIMKGGELKFIMSATK